MQRIQLNWSFADTNLATIGITQSQWEVLGHRCGQFYQSWKTSVLSVAIYFGIVGMVSLYDMFLTVRYAIYLKYMEQNPIGRWLMQLDSLDNSAVPDLRLFLLAKLVGTIIVLTAIYCLIRRFGRLGHPIAIGVSVFQLALASYLTFGTTPC